LAGTASGLDLCGGVPGCDPLSRSCGRTDREEGGVHRDRAGHGRTPGRAGHVHRGEREREVLADGAEQPEEPGRERYPDRLRGRADGLSWRNRGGIPANRTPEMRDPRECPAQQIRNTTRFVSYKEIKPLMADLKRVYVAVDEQTALSELDRFEELWGRNTRRSGAPGGKTGRG
jgi:hypothetical protein